MSRLLLVLLAFAFASPTHADENLFGYIKGAETLPEGSWELYQVITRRAGKGLGEYNALDTRTEIEYGITNRFTASAELQGTSIHSKGLQVSAYIPKDNDSGFHLSGVEAAMKYNILSPAKDDFGLAPYFSLSYSWIDKHSGQRKDTASAETILLLQKYFFEGELIWVGNFGMESTFAKRHPLYGLAADVEWPTHPETEIELISGTGLSYRILPNWYLGGELLHEVEFETEVGQERWSLFAGPSLHYGSEKWWGTFTWFPQVRGGGFEDIAGQDNKKLHLIEKTKHELRLKVGFNF